MGHRSSPLRHSSSTADRMETPVLFVEKLSYYHIMVTRQEVTSGVLYRNSLEAGHDLMASELAMLRGSLMRSRSLQLE